MLIRPVKEVSADFAQHGEVFYFYRQCLITNLKSCNARTNNIWNRNKTQTNRRLNDRQKCYDNNDLRLILCEQW
jgi:hypothetical protein